MLSLQKNVMNEYNPLLANWEYPPFDKIKTEHYLPAIEILAKQAKQEIDAIVANPQLPSFYNTIVAIDRIGEQYNKVISLFFNVLEMNADEELQRIAEQIIPITVDFSNYYSLNVPLFQKVKTIFEQKEQLSLSEEEAILLTKIYKGFLRSGANLSEEGKVKYEILTQQLSEKKLQYKNNVLAATTAFEMYFNENQIDELQGLPETDLQLASERAKKKKYEKGWLFDLSMPSYTAFMKYASNRNHRKTLYQAYNQRCLGGEYNNADLVAQIINLRLELANLLGYATYADYVLDMRMAKTPNAVFDFLNQLIAIFKPISETELAELKQFAKQYGLEDDLQAWDLSYYANLYQISTYNIDEQEFKPYFELEKVQTGIFNWVKMLYGLTFKENTKIPIYRKDVKVYDVYDETNRKISTLYMDFFPRSNKRNGAWMNTFCDQSNIDNCEVLPQVILVFNFTPPTSQTPSLLTFKEVTTFLHEFGHALHGMLSKVHFSTLSGTSVVRDFVELPSQIMENWALNKTFLRSFATHYQTNELIPTRLIDKVRIADNYLSGYYSMRQFNFALLDMQLHTLTSPMQENIEIFEINATQKTQMFPHLPNTCITTSFTHIFGGYAAGYYGYKWAEMFADDAFTVFESEGYPYKQTATKFKECILTKGESAQAIDLYLRFKGQKPTIEPMLKKRLNKME